MPRSLVRAHPNSVGPSGKLNVRSGSFATDAICSRLKGGTVKRFHVTRAVTVVPFHRVTVLPCYRFTCTDAVSLLNATSAVLRKPTFAYAATSDVMGH